MTIRTKAVPPRAAVRRRPGTGRRHLQAPFPAGPQGTRPAACKAPHTTGGAAAAQGAPGTPPSAHPVCVGGLRRTTPARRPDRAPARATMPAAGASLPADRGRTARYAASGAGLPARGTGPEGERTTGEGA